MVLAACPLEAGWIWLAQLNTDGRPACLPADEVGDHLFASLRRPNRRGCGNAAGALAAAPAAFLPQERLFSAAAAAEAGAASLSELEQLGREVCHTLLLHQQEQPKYPRIGPECPLMARKFSDGTQKVGSWPAEGLVEEQPSILLGVPCSVLPPSPSRLPA